MTLEVDVVGAAAHLLLLPLRPYTVRIWRCHLRCFNVFVNVKTTSAELRGANETCRRRMIAHWPVLVCVCVCVQFEGAISEAGQGIVHHLEVFHCEAPPHVEIPHYDGPCSSKSVRPRGLESCRKVLGAWAMGAKVTLHAHLATAFTESEKDSTELCCCYIWCQTLSKPQKDKRANGQTT